MHCVPDALPAVDASFRPYLFPSEIEAMTGMADPFRTPLPDPAAATSLDQQPPSLESIPIGFAEPVPLGARDRKPCGEVVFGMLGHRVASEPRMRLLTGVTMGPAIIMAMSTSLS